MTKEANVTIYIAIDANGDWSAMGLSDANLTTGTEVKKAMEEWNIAEHLGLCTVYRVSVKIPVPSPHELRQIEGESEKLGLLV